MKNYLILTAVCFSLSSCANFESREKLISTASFDLDCSSEKIEVISDEHGTDWGRYKLNACDKIVKYKRTGNVYHGADVDPLSSATR